MKKILIIGMIPMILLSGCVTNRAERMNTLIEPDIISGEQKLMVVRSEPEEEVDFDNHYDNMIYHAVKDTEVDPIMAIAISRLETGHYTSRAFVEGYNFGGITLSSGVESFDSLSDGLERYVTLLEWYHSEGMDTPEKMQSTYCPPNENWDEVVNDVYDDFVYKNM